MVEDKELIGQYARDHSEAAFAELVRRHLNLVHGTAIRLAAGDAQLAQDIAQTVFTDLARKAAKLSHHQSLAGWLHTSTRFTAANAVRAEVRRRTREQTAFAMNQINSIPDVAWQDLQPVIDEALGDLNDEDREAVLLRYFEANQFAAIGATLGLSENAARMRVERALDKLRGILQKRGLAVTTAGLTAALAGAAATTASAQLALAITSAALATTAGASAVSVPVLLKMALVGGGTLVVTVAAILHFQSGPVQTTRGEVVAGNREKLAVSISASSVDEKTQLRKPKVDPLAYKKLLERHDRSVEALKAKEDITKDLKGDFSKNWLKDEPGVKKFGGIIKATLTPGETLVSGGWLSPSGKRLLVFVTPQLIDAAGNPLPETANAKQLAMISKFIELPEDLLDQMNLGAFKVDGKESSMQQKISAQEATDLLQAFKKSEGVDLLTTPKVTSLLGRQAHVSVSDRTVIEGQEQNLGPAVDFLTKLSADGKSLDVVLVTQIKFAATNQTTSP